MKKVWCIGILTLATLPLLVAFAKTNPPSPPLHGTILNVDKHEVQSPEYAGGNNPTDAPLTSQYYAYDVAVRVSCGTYTGHYESAYDYLPGEIAANQPVDVRVGKHDLYFDLPGDREFKMAIVHRRTERGVPCDTGSASR